RFTQANFPALWRLAMLFAVTAFLYAAEVRPARQTLFSDYPFDEWAAAPDHSSIKWEVHLPPAQLSIHQRLVQRVETVLPGGELAKRRGRGELVVLVRFEDSEGRQWRAGNRMSLMAVEPAVRSQELTFTTAAFVRPGDYRVSIALADSETGEHNFIRRQLHIAPLKADPLPNSSTCRMDRIPGSCPLFMVCWNCPCATARTSIPNPSLASSMRMPLPPAPQPRRMCCLPPAGQRKPRRSSFSSTPRPRNAPAVLRVRCAATCRR